MEQGYTTNSRQTITRCVFSFILVSLGYHYFSHTLLHQLQSPVFGFAFIDPVYLFFSISGLASFIVQHYAVAMAIDMGLFACALSVIIFPRASWVVICFSILYFIYFVICNFYGMHHTHSMVGILLVSLPFWTKDNRKFNFLWAGLRYYTLCIYCFAFIWKLFRQSWLYVDQPMAILKDNLTAYLYFNPGTSQAALYDWFLQHPGLLFSLHIVAVAMEGFFLIGFFTRKFDHFLIVAGILVHLGIIFFVDASFIEIFVLYFTLLRFPLVKKEIGLASR